LGYALTLTAALAVILPALAADDTAPVKLDPEKRAGLNLTAIPPDAYKDILVAGELNMRVASLFEGKELRVSIFESTPAKTNHRTRPNDQDEFVYVLSGKLILTEPDGYTGTWEMQGNYREIAVVPQKNPQKK
jgi:uncharacterized cupin superfamily protein